MYISTSLSVMTEMKDVLTMSFKPEMGEHGPDITLPPLISRLVCTLDRSLAVRHRPDLVSYSSEVIFSYL